MTSRCSNVLRAAVALLVLVALPAAAQAADDARVPFPKPGSHRANWKEYHGKAAGAAGNSAGRPGTGCLVCHERTDCVACHATVMPRDHTNTWRVRTHGLMAEGNRQRCLTCHREDYCIRCHSETAPRSHTASWLRRHCAECHFGPGRALTGVCTVCHKQAVHAP